MNKGKQLNEFHVEVLSSLCDADQTLTSVWSLSGRSETDDRSIINARSITPSRRGVYISEQNRDLHLATGGVASLMSSGLVGGVSAFWTNEVSLKENQDSTHSRQSSLSFL